MPDGGVFACFCRGLNLTLPTLQTCRSPTGDFLEFKKETAACGSTVEDSLMTSM